MRDGVVTNYIYNNRDQLTGEDSSGVLITYTYDHAGCMISKANVNGTISYSWIDNDRMALVSGPSVPVSYEYDANGARIKKDDGNGPEWYLIDKQLPYGQVIAEYSSTDSLTSSYVYGLDRISQIQSGVDHYHRLLVQSVQWPLR